MSDSGIQEIRNGAISISYSAPEAHFLGELQQLSVGSTHPLWLDLIPSWHYDAWDVLAHPQFTVMERDQNLCPQVQETKSHMLLTTATTRTMPVTVNLHLLSTSSVPGNVFLHLSSQCWKQPFAVLSSFGQCGNWGNRLLWSSLPGCSGRHVIWSEPANL